MSAGPSSSETPAPRKRGFVQQVRTHAGLIVGIVIGILITLFAVLNLDTVRVNWIIGEWDTPLIVVIVVSFLAGAITLGALLALRGRGRRR